MIDKYNNIIGNNIFTIVECYIMFKNIINEKSDVILFVLKCVDKSNE